MTSPLETRSAPEADDPIAMATRTVEELRSGFAEFRTGAEQRLGAIAALEQRMGTVDTLEQRIRDLETRANRPSGGPAPAEVALERRAFTSYLRRGDARMVAEEVRALVVGDDAKGGFLAPPEFSREIIKDLVEFSPVRAVARVGAMAGASIILPKRTGTTTAHWVGEDEERPETGTTYGQVEIPAHEIACFVDVSLRIIEDAAVDVEAEVSSALAEEFGRLEGAAFIAGSGVKQPLGLLSAAGVTPFANGHATDLKADALIKMMYSLPAQYRNTGAWMMSSTTLAAVSTLKDGNGNYLWREAYAAGQPATLLGRPVVEAVDMPDAASGEFPILFGDFATAYRIYDRVGMSIMRDPYTVAAKGLIRFHARRRVGGGMVQPAALRKLKMATSV